MQDSGSDPVPPPSGQPAPRPHIARRGFVLGGVALAAGAGWALWPEPPATQVISAPDMLAALQAGQRVLVDIRRPDEWARTGVVQGALLLDMRRGDFEEALSTALGGNRAQPIAMICARGVRSRRMAARLAAAGFTNILDVSEGMEGSGAGPGWVKRGLPVVQPGS